MAAKNPHMWLTALDPPRDSPPRRWQCQYCGATGLPDKVMKTECPLHSPALPVLRADARVFADVSRGHGGVGGPGRPGRRDEKA